MSHPDCQGEDARHHEATLRSIREAVLATDAVGRVTLLNPTAEQLTGWLQAEALGQPVEVVFPLVSGQTGEALESPVRHLLVSNEVPPSGPRLLRCRDGRTLAIEECVAPIGGPAGALAGAVVVFRSTEARRRADEALRQAQRLESLGLLAGGVAHDFNNLLTPILGYASLLRSLLSDGSPALSMIDEIEASAQRGARLTQQLLVYAGQRSPELQPVSLPALAEEQAAAVMATLPEGAQMVFDLPCGVAPVDADPLQVRQLIANLLANAVEALGEGPGEVRVAVEQRQLSAAELRSPYLDQHPSAGTYAVLRVSDTGCGMAAATLGRIFEPFFSTKFTGRGLGLATVLGITRSHRGTVMVWSTPGRGSVFEVALPCVVVSRSPETQWKAEVLVLDASPSVGRMLGELLAQAGLRARHARTGEEAREFLRLPGDPFGLVLADLPLLESDAGEVLEALAQYAPQAPVIVLAGGPADAAALEALGLQSVRPLQKPFTAAAVLGLIEELHGGGR